jgi:hypothetical protein
MLYCFAGFAGVFASTGTPEKISHKDIRQCSFHRCTFSDTREFPSRYDSVSNSTKLSSLMYRNLRSLEHLGEMCLVIEKFICGFQTRTCRLRQVAEKREGFATAKRVRRSFDPGQTFYE